MNTPSPRLPQDDANAKVMRFEGVRGQRYTEIFLIDADQGTGQLTAGICSTNGAERSGPNRGHHSPAALDRIDVDALDVPKEMVTVPTTSEENI
jgi:hypothetical protein